MLVLGRLRYEDNVLVVGKCGEINTTVKGAWCGTQWNDGRMLDVCDQCIVIVDGRWSLDCFVMKTVCWLLFQEWISWQTGNGMVIMLDACSVGR